MASRKPDDEGHKATALNKSTASTGAGVAKRRYKKVRFHEDGLLNVERQTGKYFKMAQQNQRQSPLLRLPAELRNKIFAYALGGKTFKILYRQHFSPSKFTNVKKFKHALALLQVCRQIYAETALLPFSTNIFSATYPYALGEWAETLHPARAQSITWVQVKPLPPPSLRGLANFFGFGDLLSSSEIRSRGYVIVSSDELSIYYPGYREKMRKRLEWTLQAENEGFKFVWE